MMEGPPRSKAESHEKKVPVAESEKKALTDLSPDEQQILEEFKNDPSFRSEYRSGPQTNERTKKYHEVLTKKYTLDWISNAKTFEQLYQNLDAAGPLQGSQEAFEPERLKQLVERVRRGEAAPEQLTRTAGLRDAVMRLMEADAKTRKGPETPPAIEGAAVISREDFKRYAEYYKGDYRERLGPHAGYPAIGAEGLRTPEGSINGKLVWCDGVEAIFETPEGYLKVPFKRLIGPSGKTYEQTAMEDADAQRRRQGAGQAKAREIPRS